MDLENIYCQLQDIFDSKECFAQMCAIWENDRWFSRDKFQLTAQYCAETMEKAGLSVEMLPLKADGETMYFDWKMPIGWDAEKGILRYADGEIIADYREKPCQLTMYCPSTPGVVEGEVIVPDREDPEPEKYRGKILLVNQAVAKWTRFADTVGAIGVLSDVIPILPGVRDNREELYDECPWMGMSSKVKCFGMHLTPRQSEELRRRMQLGPVRLQAEIKTRTYAGISYTVIGEITGTEPGEPAVLGCGHLYEPGANDNASGTGALLYLAKLLGEEIREGRLPRPRRTIRFLLGDECWGSMGYLAAYPEKKHLCGIVADMIGTEKGDRAALSLRYDPLSNWSFADAALFTLAEIAKKRSGEFDTVDLYVDVGTDNIIADPCFEVPTVALVASPALSYHSSMDRPDRIEPDTLTRNALIIGSFLWAMANVDADDCGYLAEQIRRQTAYRCTDAVSRREELLLQAEARALHSLNRLGAAYPAASEVAAPMPEYAKASGNRIPVRKMLGVLNYMGEYNGRQIRASWNGECMVNTCWVDGKRTLWEIAYLSAVEKNRCGDAQIREEFAFVSDFFAALEEIGYLCWQ